MSKQSTLEDNDAPTTPSTLPPTGPPTPSIMNRFRTWSQGESSAGDPSPQATGGRRFFGNISSPFTKRSLRTPLSSSDATAPTQSGKSLKRRNTSDQSTKQEPEENPAATPRLRRASSGNTFFKWIDTPRSVLGSKSGSTDRKAVTKVKPIAPKNVIHFYTASEVQDVVVNFERACSSTQDTETSSSNLTSRPTGAAAAALSGLGIGTSQKSRKALQSGEALAQFLKAPIEYSKLTLVNSLFEGACSMIVGNDAFSKQNASKVLNPQTQLDYVSVLKVLAALEQRVGESSLEMLGTLVLLSLGMDEGGYIHRDRIERHLLDVFHTVARSKPRGKSENNFEGYATAYHKDVGNQPLVTDAAFFDGIDVHEKTYIRVLAFFAQGYPEKIENVSRLLEKHKNKEEKLVHKLEKQYHARIPGFNFAIEYLVNNHIAQRVVQSITQPIFQNNEKVPASTLCSFEAKREDTVSLSVLGQRLSQHQLAKLGKLPKSFWEHKSLLTLFGSMPTLLSKQWKSKLSIGCWMRVHSASRGKGDNNESNVKATKGLQISHMRFIRRFAQIRLHRSGRGTHQVAVLELYETDPGFQTGQQKLNSNVSPVTTITLDGATIVNRVYRSGHKHPYTIELLGSANGRATYMQPSSMSGKLRRRGIQDHDVLEAAELVDEWVLALRLATQKLVMLKLAADQSTWSRGKRSIRKVIRTLQRPSSASRLFSARTSLKRSETESKDEDQGNDKHKLQVESFFRKHNPEKLKDVESILAKYNGREDILIEKLQKQYGVSITNGIEESSDEYLSEDGDASSYLSDEGGEVSQDKESVSDIGDSQEKDGEVQVDSPATRLTKFYAKYNPKKLSDIPSILQRYQGREDVLFAKLQKQYNVD